MMSALFQLQQSQWLDPDQLWAQQRRQLRELLLYSCRHVPFYRQGLQVEFARLSDEFSLREYSRLPLLTRADIQQHFRDLCSDALPRDHGAASAGTTSGSTGEPIRFLSTLVSTFFWHAFTLREHLWHKRDFRADMVAIRVEKESSVEKNWFGEVGAGIFRTGRCVVIPAHWTFDRQLARILEEKPAYLLGYANNLLGVLQLADQRRVELPWLREVRSFGEAVSPELRAYVRDRWKVPFSDVYSARETGYIALQCPDHEAYHIQSESAIVEVVDDGGNHCAPGEIGCVVVTPLHNFGMPLIRYDIGDYAEVGGPCACGRGLPVLTRIQGRSRNLLALPDGSRRWPTLAPGKLLGIAPIRRYKIVQKSIADVEIRLIVDRPLHENELAALRSHFADQLGHAFNWTFRFLDEFPPTSGDKFEDFVSEVA